MSNTISALGKTLAISPRRGGAYAVTDPKSGDVIGWLKPKSFGCWTFTKNNGERMEGPTRYTMVEAMAAEAQRAHMIASKRSRNTITEHPTIHETSDGSTVDHAVGVDGEVLGWAVEYRSTDGETIGWGVWGDRGPDGLLASRDEAAQWIAEHL